MISRNYPIASGLGMDPSLTDVSAGAEFATLVAGNLDNNKTQIWNNMSLPAMSHVWHKSYDVVFDFGSDGNSYQGYDYLGQQLATRGFICASVALHELVSGWRIHHRI